MKNRELPPQRSGQAKMMIICEGPNKVPAEVGQWYSPKAVAELIAAECECCANQRKNIQKKLQVWWIPQVPMKAFTVDVATVEEGVKLMEVLADYDRFQFENRVKSDYCNMGGLNQWDEDNDGEGTPGWRSWYDDETGEDDPVAWLESRSSVEVTG